MTWLAIGMYYTNTKVLVVILQCNFQSHCSYNFKALSQQNQLKLYLPICLTDDGVDILSRMYDSVRAVKCVSLMVCFTSTHYPGAVYSQTGRLFSFLSATNIYCTFYTIKKATSVLLLILR